jgi:hypothetical protein
MLEQPREQSKERLRIWVLAWEMILFRAALWEQKAALHCFDLIEEYSTAHQFAHGSIGRVDNEELPLLRQLLANVQWLGANLFGFQKQS